MPSTRTEFTGSQSTTLAARLDTPDTPPRAWAVFAHCFTCSKDTKAAAHIARALAAWGFGVLRFNFTGLGWSTSRSRWAAAMPVPTPATCSTWRWAPALR